MENSHCPEEAELSKMKERFPLTWKYQPYLDDKGWIAEKQGIYTERMWNTHLPNWPEEPLLEWLHRHHGYDLETYASLHFERFWFSKERWDLKNIPGREAFRDERFCDSFQDVEVRAATNPSDWLAHYMLKEGTWNTPVILLSNRATGAAVDGRPLKTPYHLLEGHRRLSFLQGLKCLNKAQPTHEIWIVDVLASSATIER